MSVFTVAKSATKSALEELLDRFGEKGAKQAAKAAGEELTEESAPRILQKASERDAAMAAEDKAGQELFDPIKDEESKGFDSFLDSNRMSAKPAPADTPAAMKGPAAGLFDKLDAAATPKAEGPQAGAMFPKDASADAGNPMPWRSKLGRGAAAAGVLGAAGYGASGSWGDDEQKEPGVDGVPVPGEGPDESAEVTAESQGPALPKVPWPTSAGKFSQAPLKTPEDVNAILERYDGVIAEQSGPIKATLEKKKAELDQAAQIIQDEYKENKQRLAWGEVAETLAHALAQFGAGLQGLKTKTDMTGMKFNKSDWESKYKLAFDELKNDLSGIQDRRGEAIKSTDSELGDVKDRAGVGLKTDLGEREHLQREQSKRDEFQRGEASKEASDARGFQKDVVLEGMRSENRAKLKAEADEEKSSGRREAAINTAMAGIDSLANIKSDKRGAEMKRIVENYYKNSGAEYSPELEQAMQKVLKPGFFEKSDPETIKQLFRRAASASKSVGAGAPAAANPGVAKTTKKLNDFSQLP